MTSVATTEPMKDIRAVKWINERASLEQERLRELAVKRTYIFYIAILMQPLNFGVINNEDIIINRIEFRTNFDFGIIVGYFRKTYYANYGNFLINHFRLAILRHILTKRIFYMSMFY
jgi:hypothetical protein